jgi:hypothetical protein
MITINRNRDLRLREVKASTSWDLQTAFRPPSVDDQNQIGDAYQTTGRADGRRSENDLIANQSSNAGDLRLPVAFLE